MKKKFLTGFSKVWGSIQDWAGVVMAQKQEASKNVKTYTLDIIEARFHILTTTYVKKRNIWQWNTLLLLAVIQYSIL